MTYSSPVSNHSSDLPNSRLIPSRTSAPTSLAFVPCGDVGKTVCQRNINNWVLLPLLPGHKFRCSILAASRAAFSMVIHLEG